MIAVMKPLTVLHILALTVIFDEFLTIDFPRTVVFVEKAALFKQVTFFHGSYIYPKYTNISGQFQYMKEKNARGNKLQVP
jgi:hypothetical protein